MKTLIKSIFLGLIIFVEANTQNPIRIVSNAPNLQYQADVDGDYVVYWSNQDSDHHIYLYKISDSSTTKITTYDNSGKTHPIISGNYIFWSDNRNGDYDIYFYDINNPQLGDRPLLVSPPYGQVVMDADGTKLLIMDYQGNFPNYNNRLICYDFLTQEEVLIKEDPYPDNFNSASISGNLVVYDYKSDIYLYNLFTKETEIICNNPYEQRNPVISGDVIVWEDNRNGDWDLYQCNLWYWQSGAHLNDWPLSQLAIERYKSTRSNQQNPNIKNKMLVFTDDAEEGQEIYLLNYKNDYRLIGPVTRISNSEYINCEPVTDGKSIVWWDDKNPNPYIISNSDVYLWQRPPGADLSLSLTANSTKLQIEESITLTFTISNFGPLHASNITMIDTISDKIQIISASSTSGDVTVSNNIITFNANNLPINSSIEITVIGKATITGKADIIGLVSAQEPDYITQNNDTRLTIKINDVRTIQLTSNNYGNHQRIKVDKNNFVHIISYQEFPILLKYITNKTGSWTEEILDSTQGDLFITGADLDLDEQGNAHVVYVISPYGMGYPSMTLYYTNNTSGQWTSTLPMGPSGGEMYRPCIKIDKNNFVHLCYMTNIWGGDLHYLNNKNGNWSTPDTLIRTYAYNSTSMDVDTNGYAHIVTYFADVGPIYGTKSPNGLWHLEQVESGWIGGQKEMMSLDIKLDNSSNPHVSYVGNVHNNEDYKYAVKLNGTWHHYFVALGGFMGGHNRITLDNNNIPYIIYASLNNNELKYAKKEGDSFTSYLIESDFYNYVGYYYDIDVDNYNNIHYVYYSDEKLYYGTSAIYTIHNGGGDENSGGYFFANSIAGGNGAPSQPTYNWIDPVMQGHNYISDWSEGNADDGYFGPVDLPFCFNFFDIAYDKFYINSNGFISFIKGYAETAENALIPFIDEPNGILAACAMDLNLDTILHPESKIYYGGDYQKFIVTYYHTYSKKSPSDYITFQIIIYSNGSILYQYNSQESSLPLPSSIADDALIGIENEVGTKGICYRNNGVGGPIFSSPLAIMFGQNALTLPVIDYNRKIVEDYILYQNYPNPFNPSTTIRFDIPKASFVTLKIYNILGQEITTLVNGYKNPGRYEINFDASSLPSGVYFYRLIAGEYISTKKLLLVR